MKRRAYKLLGIILAFALAVSGCLIPAKAFATPISSYNVPIQDELDVAETFDLDKNIEVTDYYKFEAFRFHTLKPSGVYYNLSYSNYTSEVLAVTLLVKDNATSQYVYVDDINVDINALKVTGSVLKPNRDYCLLFYADNGGGRYSFEVNVIPEKPGKGKITSLRAGRKRLTVKYKKTNRTNRYQIAVRKKGGKWKYYRATSLKKTIKKLKSKKRYYVKVRGIFVYQGKQYKGKWSSVKSVRVK